MAELKFYSPFAENDNFDVSSAEHSTDANQLFISNRILRGEYVTEANSGLSHDEWNKVISKFD
jgi:hypothetical protein